MTSFSSGQLLEYFGWQAINEVIFPTIFIAGATLVAAKQMRRDRVAMFAFDPKGTLGRVTTVSSAVFSSIAQWVGATLHKRHT